VEYVKNLFLFSFLVYFEIVRTAAVCNEPDMTVVPLVCVIAKSIAVILGAFKSWFPKAG